MDNLGFLAAAYTIIFVAIFLYVVFLWRRQAQLNAEMRRLEMKLEGLRAELTREAPPDSRSSSR
jgi:CcmD family protein